MKKYTKPEMEINTLNNVDVITKSGGVNLSKFTESNKGYNVIDNF
jgi:hypothetical protein